VLIGFFIFGEALTARLMMGVVVILAAVILIVFSRHVNKLFNRLMNK
jgi:drug/metabolite transporter (DMT)-like permease